LYKHYTHEGGISSPFIVHWPSVIHASEGAGGITRQLGHITDIMPTLLAVAHTTYPQQFNSHAILPLEGTSLGPIFTGGERPAAKPIFWEHEGNRAVRSGAWKLVSRYPGPWELYDMEADRTELHNLADRRPEKVRELASLYDQWARRCGVVPPDQLPEPKKLKPDLLGEGAN
jgi:arylsulfatase